MSYSKHNDWKKTAWKFTKSAGFVILAGLATNYGQNSYYLVLAPALAAFENYLKHGTNLYENELFDWFDSFF